MNCFGRTEKVVLSMIQPEPLPGSYRHSDLRIDAIVDQALRETEMVARNHFDGIIVQNMNDMPVKQKSSPEAIAYMTRISYEIRKRFPELVMGILMNWDGVAGLCVADAVGADFVRVEHLFTGASVTSAGILEAQCVDIAGVRKRTGSKVPMYMRSMGYHLAGNQWGMLHGSVSMRHLPTDCSCQVKVWRRASV